MAFLFDTHLLIWAALGSKRLPAEVRMMLDKDGVVLHFSAASVWEIAIKSVLQKSDCRVDAGRMRRGLLATRYRELSISGIHAAATATLPLVHKDPFDRLLIAQAQVEGMLLMTVDKRLQAYGDMVRVV